MTHVGHLFDASAGWEQRIGVNQLLDRLPKDRYEHRLATVDPKTRSRLGSLLQSVEVVRPVLGLTALAGPAVKRFAADGATELIHAWGVRAAVAARTVMDRPLVLELFDPCIAVHEIKRIRTLAASGPFAAVCSCEIVRRRLLEGGLAPHLAVVIRPGVDFGLINQTQRSPFREQLGVNGDRLLALVPHPVTRTGGQAEAYWALSLRNSIRNDVRVIVPGHNQEVQRIERLAANIPGPSALVTTGHRYPFEQLVAVSDVLLVTPRGDLSTTSIAWAMAAGVPVVAAAVYSVAELISSRVNGLLFKQTPDRSMSATILRLLEDRPAQSKAAETARGQAYEVFGIRRYVEQHMRLYENLLAGAEPGEGLIDSAIVA